MLKPVPDKPRRNFVKKAARTFMLASKQDELPIDVDSLFEDNGWLLMPAETAEQQVGMSIPIEFWQNDSAEALTCYYADKFITLYKTLGANIDAVQTAGRFGIAPDRAVDYLSDSEGTQLNYTVMAQAVAKFREEGTVDGACFEEIRKDVKRRGGRK